MTDFPNFTLHFDFSEKTRFVSMSESGRDKLAEERLANSTRNTTKCVVYSRFLKHFDE